jgi:hypothetical protein
VDPTDKSARTTPLARIHPASRKTSDSTDKFNGQNPLDIAITNALGLLRGQNFENWPRGDPRATGHAKYEQNYGQNEHLARANKAPDGPDRSPPWPRGLPRHFDFPAGRVGGFGAHSSTGAAPFAKKMVDRRNSLRWGNRVAAPVLCSRKISIGREKKFRIFFLTTLGL